MKRLLVLILLGLSLSLVSANPLSRIYQIDDPILEKIVQLSIESGVNAPSSGGPISGHELLKHIQLIDYSKLSPLSKQQYEEIEDYIQTPFTDKDWDYSILFSQGIYANTQSDTAPSDWIQRYNDRSPLLYGEVESVLGKSVYGTISYALQKAYREADFSGIASNNPFLINNEDSALQNSVPHTAFMGTSGDSYTLVFGRDSIRYGRGNTGNLMVGDQAPYHDFLLASVTGKQIKYTFLALPMNELISREIFENRIDPSGESELGEAWYPHLNPAGSWHTLFHGTLTRIYLSHRFEINPSPRLRFSLTEGTLFYVDRMDLRMFSPLMFLHNLQNFGEVNNSMGLEIEWLFSPGWLLNTQLFLDQFQTGGEQDTTAEIPPNAYAGLVGIRNEKVMDEWRNSNYMEAVYTSPYVYLRTADNTHNYVSGDETYANEEYNLDFVHAVSMEDGKSGVSWLGYTYGPDSIVLALKSKFTHKNKFSIDASLRFIVQGERGLLIENKEQQVILQKVEDINTPSPSGPTPEFTLVVGTAGSMVIPNTSITIHGSYYLVNRWFDYDYSMDHQTMVGLKYSL
ncbi:hypothetical protein [Pleomorphochaeta sp. DL1XJH-081]|uniref:hypothetical protein n=1 Tax=Pleomorphochaeta sp. DL1XJH-081 TaxID=3409690 RepID=UPI003BB4953E